jgi:hypothetical protein
MKKFLFLLLSILLFSCETPKKKEKKKPIPKEVIKEVVPEKNIKKVDPTYIRLQRKPCSGDCPVFEVVIKKDSTLTYKGIKYAHSIGTHTVKLTAKQYTKLTSIIEASHFDQLQSRYTKSGSKDFPETVITYHGKKVTVRLWKDAPDKLTDIYVFIEDILYDYKYLQ